MHISEKSHSRIKYGIPDTTRRYSSPASMSRFYRALGDTTSICMKCKSSCALFGNIDETDWFGWCAMSNETWRNRRVESVLLAVSQHYFLATLTGSNETALTVLTFLQTNTECVKHCIQLRHHLNIQVLMWICCPLAWWYVSWEDMRSYDAAAAERRQHPVLRTLQETFVLSATFKEMCLPCQITRKMFSVPLELTLLQMICLYIKWPWTAHNCAQKQQLRLNHARDGQTPQHVGTADTRAELSARR